MSIMWTLETRWHNIVMYKTYKTLRIKSYGMDWDHLSQSMLYTLIQLSCLSRRGVIMSLKIYILKKKCVMASIKTSLFLTFQKNIKTWLYELTMNLNLWPYPDQSRQYSVTLEDFLKTHVLRLSFNLCFKATTTALAQPQASLIHTPQPLQLWPSSLISFSSSLTNAWPCPGALLLHTMTQTPSHCCNLRDLYCCKWSLGVSMILATCNWNT